MTFHTLNKRERVKALDSRATVSHVLMDAQLSRLVMLKSS